MSNSRRGARLAGRDDCRGSSTQTAALRMMLAGLCLTLAGCAQRKSSPQLERPDIAPAAQPSFAGTLELDASHIKPIYREVLPVDLASVVRVAVADSLDIAQARVQMEASRGRLESTIGAAFPAIVPTALFDHVEGTVRATEGNLVGVGFNTFQPSIAVQWVVNPGKVIYEIVAAKKRLVAEGHQQRAVVMETIRRAAVHYYDLVLAQAGVAAAARSQAEAEELLRIATLATQTGTGVPADELRAQARLAARQQDLLQAMQTFYDASVTLAVTLHLDDPSVTLVPSISELPPIQLVRPDLDLDELLGFAVAFRPDLESVRVLAEAAIDDKGATWWGAFGPQFRIAYEYGGITGHANDIVAAEGIPGNLIVNPLSPTGAFAENPVANGLFKEAIARGSRRGGHRADQTFGFSDQQRFGASAQARWSLAAIGDLKTAGARERQALIDAQRQLDGVRAQVVRAYQAAKTNHELIAMADQQVTAAREALRLTQVNLQAGMMTILDVLQAQDAVSQARLRHAGAVVRYNQAEVDLVAAIGLLRPEVVIGGGDRAVMEPAGDSTAAIPAEPTTSPAS